MEPLAHYMLPVVFMLAFNPRTDRRTVLKYSPLAVLPDIDFFFGHAILHNIFAPALIGVVVYHVTKKNREALLLSLFFLYSHLILDLGFVALLYPAKANVISLDFNIYTSPGMARNMWGMITGETAMHESILKADNRIRAEPIEAAENAPMSPVFTQLSLMLILLALLTLAFKQFKGKHR
ncbi:MAG: hypothetical protein GF416_07520 [Candidatus Altiarchaeales archaeon]|nr:hypothetical protein [Candidatus Altiarchaeales archaeon]MBD3416961.1 hypothetical protein [Candidatus Altiarchaeales archaeon]